MTPHWIIEKDVFDQTNYDKMRAYFIENHIKYNVIKVVPFEHTIYGKVPIVEGPCVAYGSIGIQDVAKKHGWNPGVWTSNEINESNVKNKLSDLYLNNDVILTSLDKVLDDVDLDEFFIKPNTDSKEFAGEVLTRKEFTSWLDNLLSIGYLDDNNISVVVSTPKNIIEESRFIIVDGKISSQCIYKQYGILKPQPQLNFVAIGFVLEVLKQFDPLPVYVIDIAKIGNGGEMSDFKVIEYNTFNSAGLYVNDIAAIIKDINNYVMDD